jgi:hypothetical protein
MRFHHFFWLENRVPAMITVIISWKLSNIIRKLLFERRNFLPRMYGLCIVSNSLGSKTISQNNSNCCSTSSRSVPQFSWNVLIYFLKWLMAWLNWWPSSFLCDLSFPNQEKNQFRHCLLTHKMKNWFVIKVCISFSFKRQRESNYYFSPFNLAEYTNPHK